MTYYDVGRYVDNYIDAENEKKEELIKLFCIYNAESVSIGVHAGTNRKASSVVKNYSLNVIKRKLKKEDEKNDNQLDDQFNDYFPEIEKNGK